MHTSKIVETKQINNETVAYRIVCCDAACSSSCSPSNHVCEDTWHTVSTSVPDHDALLEQHKKDAETRHEAIIQWRLKYRSLVNV
jgi:hypothetical protein